MFQPQSEAYIRKSWYSVLPVLDMMGRCHVKKAVVCMAQLVAVLITVHGLLSFLSDVYGLFDPSGKMLWVSVNSREPCHPTGLKRRWSTENQIILPDGSKRPYTSKKKGQQSMNHDEGSYQPSYAYDRLLDTASSRCAKNRKNWVPASSDEGLW